MSQPPRLPRHPGSAIGLMLLATLCATVPAAAHARGARARTAGAAGGASRAKRPPRAPKVTPNQDGKIVVFPFKDDDDRSIALQVERLLRSRGLEVVTGVRPVDTAEQYREMAGTMGLVAYVDGVFKEGEANAKLTVQVRSGYTGRRVALTTFKETKLHLRGEVEDKLWTKVGPALARACADASKPRKRGRGPLVIEAGTPLASTDSAPNQ